MSTFTLYENLSLARELSAFFAWMAILSATVITIWSYFLTKFFAWMMFVSLFTAFFMALDSTFMPTWKGI